MWLNKERFDYVNACKDLPIFDVERAYDGGYEELGDGWLTLDEALTLFNKTTKEDCLNVELCFADFGTIEHAHEQVAQKRYDVYNLNVAVIKLWTKKKLVLSNGKLRFE